MEQQRRVVCHGNHGDSGVRCFHEKVPRPAKTEQSREPSRLPCQPRPPCRHSVGERLVAILTTTAQDNFVLRAADLEKLITPRTRMVIADSPSNPSGAVIPPDEFEKVLAVCQRHGVWLLADECYSHFTYGDAKPFSIASISGSKNSLIIVGSFSKTFAKMW